MIPPEIPQDEPSRLAALHRLGLLDTPPDDRFDRFVRMARRLLDTAAAAVSFVDKDRQWFKATAGLELRQTKRDLSFCGHTVAAGATLVVPDAATDDRFHDNPMVDSGFRFYAGVPLRTPDGHAVGTICVLDSHPRELGVADLEALEDLAQLASHELAMFDAMDATTGLLDRFGFERASQSMLDTCFERELTAVLFHVSLDLLELIDEAHGHEEGERALREMGDVLRATFRQGDVVGRIGSEHFCALCASATLDDVRALTSRIERRIEAANVLRGPKWPLTFRVTYSVYEPTRRSDWMELLAMAHPEQPRIGNTPEPQYRR